MSVHPDNDAVVVAAVCVGAARALGMDLLDKAREAGDQPGAAIAEFVGRTWIGYAELMQRVLDGEVDVG